MKRAKRLEHSVHEPSGWQCLVWHEGGPCEVCKHCHQEYRPNEAGFSCRFARAQKLRADRAYRRKHRPGKIVLTDASV